MHQILVYGDSLSWGIIPNSRRRLEFVQRWPGVVEAALNAMGSKVRVIEDCLNGRRTVWDDPFKPGRNGLHGLAQRIEVNSPLALVVIMLGTNDFQATHSNSAYQSAQGVAAIVTAIRAAPIEPGLPAPPILVVAPPPISEPKGSMALKFEGSAARCTGLAAEYEKVCLDLQCAFFDAGLVTGASVVDGVHLDADQHAALGRALATVMAAVITQAGGSFLNDSGQ